MAGTEMPPDGATREARGGRRVAVGPAAYDAIVVGSGFSGSLLARILGRSGWRVLLVDRERHPRFALGESTTPLANLALERIGAQHGLPELGRLATYGRWLETFPDLRRGLKRGFSFYLQRPGVEWRPGPRRRLLVAASPDDRVADTHWLREDVDALFARLAVADGVELREGSRVVEVSAATEAVRLTLVSEGTAREVTASMAIDASGPAGVVARSLGASDGAPLATRSALLYGHFRGVGELAEAVQAGSLPQSGELSDAPYPEDRAAVHHLLDEGWMYLLAFDHGVTSAGILLDRSAGGGDVGDAPAAWDAVIGRYPTLARLFEGAEPIGAVRSLARVQHRLSSAYGRRWVAMPHTYGFVDPLFSTGIAWSLRAVERLAEILVDAGPRHPSLASGLAFTRYGERLDEEIECIDRLVASAYMARHRFDLFAAHSLLYFSAVSFSESVERLGRRERPWWNRFLGAGEVRFDAMLAESDRRLRAALADAGSAEDYRRWIAETIEPFDIAGLGTDRGNLYPVDLAELERSAWKLGLDEERLKEGFERLRAELRAS